MKTITISGPPGAGSTTTAKILSEKLSMNYFSPGRLFKDIAKGQVKNQYYYKEFKELCDEKNIEIPNLNSPNDSNATVDLWQTPLGKSEEFHNIIDNLQLVLAKRGNIVIDGKLSLHMIANADLKVWINSSMDERTKRSAQRDNLELEEARKIITYREEKERKEWKKIYGFDYFQQESKAHIIIDSSNLSPEQVINLILAKL